MVLRLNAQEKILLGTAILIGLQLIIYKVGGNVWKS